MRRPGRGAPRWGSPAQPPPPSSASAPSSGIYVERRDRSFGLVGPMDLDFELSIELRRERERHRAVLCRPLDLIAVDVNLVLRGGQVDTELDLITLVVRECLHPADGIPTCVDVENLDTLRRIAARIAVVVLEHDEDHDRRDDNRADQSEPCSPRLHFPKTSLDVRTVASLQKRRRNARGFGT